ncbi:MAG: hypothetical protein K1X44_08905 [Alphaproteobacteria bacterium]|nr:hypothetical protein [Alphaproteobacteria bacterium]
MTSIKSSLRASSVLILLAILSACGGKGSSPYWVPHGCKDCAPGGYPEPFAYPRDPGTGGSPRPNSYNSQISSLTTNSPKSVEKFIVEGHLVEIIDRQTVRIDGMEGKEFNIDGHHVEVLGIDSFKIDGQVFYIQLPPPPRSKVTTAPKFQGSGNAAFTQAAPPPRVKAAVKVTAQNGQATTMFGAPPPRKKVADTTSNNDGVAARDRQASEIAGDDED